MLARRGSRYLCRTRLPTLTFDSSATENEVAAISCNASTAAFMPHDCGAPLKVSSRRLAGEATKIGRLDRHSML